MTTVLETRLEERPLGLVAVVRFCGEKRLNLVSQATLNTATEQFRDLSETAGLRCVVLSGADDQAFIGGANLQQLGSLTPDTAEAFIRSIHNFCAALRQAPQPVIAAMRGYCIGAGLEIAAACDIRIGDETVQCGMPEVRVGVPSVIEAALLPGLIGWGRARELMLRGNLLNAEQSLACGLLQHCLPAAELEAAALNIADDICHGTPQAMAAQKALFDAWENLPIDAAIEAGVKAFVRAYESDEPATAVAEFFAQKKT